MGLSGTLDSMPVPELVGWLGLRPRTGVLKLRSRGVVKSINLDGGLVVGASSTDPREYLGQFMINLGLISEDHLQKAFETQLQTRVLLGRILVMTGLLEEAQVLRVLELKIRETLLDAFLWDGGGFEFHDGLLPAETSEVQIRLPLEQMAQEGARRRAQHVHIRRTIPDNACVFSPGQPPPPSLAPTSTSGILLELGRMGLSAADIILRFHSPDFPVLRSLHELVERGLLRVRRPQPRSAEPTAVDIELTDVVDENATEPLGPDVYLVQAEAAMTRRDYAAAALVLAQGLARHEHDPMLSAALETAEQGLVEALRQALRPARSVPVRVLVPRDALSASDLTPAERYLLDRVDGQRSLAAIIRVSPLREVDALRAIQALVGRGVISLQGG
jgi:hypothetical protein